MYTVEPYRVEIRLISNLNGLVGVYPDYESFLDSLSYEFIDKRIVTTFRDWPIRWYLWGYREPYERFVVRDKFGSVFSSNEVLNDFIARGKLRYRSRCPWIEAKYNFVYRQTPVPRTGKIKGYFKFYYKRPKTTQERRWSCAHKEYVRGKRRNHLLPNAYDDKPRGDIDNRKCWKNKKVKRQWMKNLG